MHILRITNKAGHTSSPFNLFTLARARLYPDEQTTFLSFANNFLSKYFHEMCTNKQYNFHKQIYIYESNNNIFKFILSINNFLKNIRNSSNKSIIHLHQPGSSFLFFIFGKYKAKSIPTIYTVHNNYANYAFRHKMFMFLSFLLADKVTFVSWDSWNSFSNKLIRPSNKKSIVIQNGVDIARIDTALNTLHQNRNENDPIFRFITIGRCCTQKNQQFLLDVLQKLNINWTLDIYGEGDLSAKLHKEVKARNLTNRVRFNGVVPRDDVFRSLARADVFLSPSLWEGLPVALMEAMGVGIPCIVSNISSHNEVGVATEGVKLTDLKVEAWLECIQRLAQMDSQERKAIGLKNREIIQSHFSVRVMQQKYRELYEYLVLKHERLSSD
jgi:glycosyltransferase involved in cell wall biosynthesis